MKVSQGFEAVGGIERYHVKGRACACCNRHTVYGLPILEELPPLPEDARARLGSRVIPPLTEDERAWISGSRRKLWVWCGHCGSIGSLHHDGLLSPTMGENRAS